MKKFIAYLLTVSVLLSMLVVNVSAADEGISAERVTKFENAVTLLTKIGAISEDAYDFDTGISKGEFVDIMSKIVPVSDGSLVPAFQDVPATHEYFKVIQGFADAGYIDGHAGFFEPDRDITYNEALYIAMNTMGYKDFMAVVGAFPTGGWKIAEQLEIKMRNKGAVAGDIFYMLYQALTTDMLAITGMKKDAFVFSTENSETLLEKYLEIEATEGVLKSNGMVSLVGGKDAKDDVIIIDGISYNTDEPCEILAGCLVDAFYYMDTNDIVCVLAADENKIVEINSADIEYYKDGKYTYRVDGAKKTLKVQDTTDIVVNNVLVAEIEDESVFEPVNGKVIAVDDGKGDGYDVIYIKDYKSFVARSVVNDEKDVTIKAENKYGIPAVIAHLENDVPAVYDAEGNRISIEDITIGTVVSVMGNVVDGAIIAEEIVVSKGVVTGALTTIAKGSKPYLVIDDETYPIAASTAEELLKSISPQIDMTFFVDFLGNIVDLDDSISGSMAYGYLLSARMGDNDDGDRVIVAEIFSEIGAIIEYRVSNKKFYQDGNASAGKFIDETTFENVYLPEFQKHVNELVRYDVNNDRQLYKIDFSKSITEGGTATVDDRLYMSVDNMDNPAYAFTQFYGSKKAFGDKVHVDDDTIIFKLPDFDEDAMESEYKIIRSVGGLKDGRYAIKAYKLGTDMMYAKVVVLRELLDPTLSADHKGNVMVTDVTEVLDDYGEPTYSITVLGMDGEKTYVTKTKKVGDDPVKLVSNSSANRVLTGRGVIPGDIVRLFLTEDESSVAQIVVCFSIQDGKSTDGGSYTDNWAQDEGTYKTGYVYAMDDKRISVATGDVPTSNKILRDSDYSTYMLDSFKIYKVEVTGEGKDRMANEITPATKADLKSFKLNGGDCSEVLAISSRGTGQLLFIFE